MPASLLRIPEAAERLNVSRSSVYRWMIEGRLPAVQLGGPGSPLRIPADELEVWLHSPAESVGDRPPATPDERRESSPVGSAGDRAAGARGGTT
jgi:excisionase family DNA binding protein